MTLRVWGIFLSFCLLSVQLAGAQVRQVTGRVMGQVLRTTTVPSGIPAADEVASEDEAA